jgi:hypothetical protein
MASFRVVCTDQTDCSSSGHITGVGTGDDPGAATSKWTVAQVWSAMDSGDSFHTISASTGLRAKVEKLDCPCGRGSLRSAADAVTDNNLDNLRICRWK